MYAIPFWNTNDKDDLEEHFVMLAASKERGIELIKEIAQKENRVYRLFVCDAKEWVVSEVGHYEFAKTMVEWCEEDVKTIEIDPHVPDFSDIIKNK